MSASAARHLPLVGPGSRSDPELDASPLAFVALPDLAATRPSRLAPVDLGAGAVRVLPLVRRVLAALRGEPGAEDVVAVVDRDPATLAAVDEVFGEGEVRLVVTGAATYRIEETKFPGVWRVRTEDRDGRLVGDHLEVGDVPRVVRAAAEHGTSRAMGIPTAREGVMNAMPLLAELRARALAEAVGENHVVTLTLLPLTTEDLAVLQTVLGTGPVQGESRGYGICHVTLTAWSRVWSVQYLNAMGAPVLDTLEVGDVPSALRATTADREDSAARLAEVLAVWSP